ncbi:hypothetical protein FNV43_RR13017 [Rhamnella rubrinervis]|uniref:Uncharacterized protein n=1 Tax=Rhamnella rubrinervis TaxID=2594499 RepID=A0A8K0H0D2_9ROSA|nr:hypothetical protein FNV43_RR13017 [Rhamnella rubrinervis]
MSDASIATTVWLSFQGGNKPITLSGVPGAHIEIILAYQYGTHSKRDLSLEFQSQIRIHARRANLTVKFPNLYGFTLEGKVDDVNMLNEVREKVRKQERPRRSRRCRKAITMTPTKSVEVKVTPATRQINHNSGDLCDPRILVGDLVNSDGVWNLLTNFRAAYPQLTICIEDVEIAMDKPDERLWAHSVSGTLSCRDIYLRLSTMASPPVWVRYDFLGVTFGISLDASDSVVSMFEKAMEALLSTQEFKGCGLCACSSVIRWFGLPDRIWLKVFISVVDLEPMASVSSHCYPFKGGPVIVPKYSVRGRPAVDHGRVDLELRNSRPSLFPTHSDEPIRPSGGLIDLKSLFPFDPFAVDHE